MFSKKTNLTVAAVIGLILVGATLSWFLAPDIIEAGLDSSFSDEAEHEHGRFLVVPPGDPPHA